MLDCFLPVWGLVILFPSQICEFLFHVFIRLFFLSVALVIRKVGIPPIQASLLSLP